METKKVLRQLTSEELKYEIKSLEVLAEGYYEKDRESTLDDYIEKLQQDIAIIRWSFMLNRLEKGWGFPKSIMEYYFKTFEK